MSIVVGESSGDQLQLKPAPVLRCLLQYNPLYYSDVFVWTYQGRPEVVAAITSVYGNRRTIETEIHSLSTRLPRLSYEDKRCGSPKVQGWN